MKLSTVPNRDHRDAGKLFFPSRSRVLAIIAINSLSPRQRSREISNTIRIKLRLKIGRPPPLGKFTSRKINQCNPSEHQLTPNGEGNIERGRGGGAVIIARGPPRDLSAAARFRRDDGLALSQLANETPTVTHF